MVIINKKNIILVLFLGLVIFLLGYFNQSRNLNFSDIKKVVIKDRVFDVRVSDDDAERSLGLGNTVSMLPNQGMLFVFEKSSRYFFWMKDMLFSLDMIWIDENMKIVHIERGVDPETFPKTFGPKDKTSRFVLEVLSGVSESLDLEIGDKVQFKY